MRLLVLILLSCPYFLGQDPFKDGQWVDLSYDLSSETIYWPTANVFSLKSEFKGQTEKGYFYSANQFCASEHGGTHIDAPIHFAEGKQTVDQIPIQNLMGPCIVIDVSEKAAKNRDYQVGIVDFENWESVNGKIPDRGIVMLRTGFGKYWPDRVAYMGTDQLGPEAVAKLHFPGLDPLAASWLVTNRNVAMIGLDTPSIDFGQSTHFESHQILFKDNVAALENVANLEQLPVVGSYLMALPIKIKGGSGGPTRIVAWIPEK